MNATLVLKSPTGTGEGPSRHELRERRKLAVRNAPDKPKSEGNPYHDSTGAFTSKEKAAAIAASHRKSVEKAIVGSQADRDEALAKYGKKVLTWGEHAPILEDWGATDADDLQRKMHERLTTAIQKAKPFIRVNVGDLTKILSSGQILNAFDTGKSHAAVDVQGNIALERRRHVEQKLFGIPEHADGTSRPVYGYLASGDGISEMPKGRLMGAGGVAIQLKEETKAHSTFTVGDSLDEAVTLMPEMLGGGWLDSGVFAPQPVLQPSTLAIPSGVGIRGKMKVWPKKLDIDWDTLDEDDPRWMEAAHEDKYTVESTQHAEDLTVQSYLELQIHPPPGRRLQVSDIASITFATPPSQTMQKKLAKLGIPWVQGVAQKIDYTAVMKWNPWHDVHGWFTSKAKAAAPTIGNQLHATLHSQPHTAMRYGSTEARDNALTHVRKLLMKQGYFETPAASQSKDVSMYAFFHPSGQSAFVAVTNAPDARGQYRISLSAGVSARRHVKGPSYVSVLKRALDKR